MKIITPFDAFMILLVLTPLWMLALHASASRILRVAAPGVQPQLTVLLCAALGILPMAAGLWYLYLGDLAGLTLELSFGAVYAFLVYGALAYVYFHLFNMSETARRIKILSVLYREGAVDRGRLGSSYGAEEMLEARLGRLISTGQIREADGRYVTGGKGLYLAARVVALWASVLGLPFDKGGVVRADGESKKGTDGRP